MDNSILILVGLPVILSLVGAFFFLKRPRQDRATPQAKEPSPEKPISTEVAEPIAVPKKENRFQEKLKGTRNGFVEKLGKFFAKAPSDSVCSSEWDEIEEALLTGDVGLSSTQKLIAAVKQKSEGKGGHGLRSLFVEAGEQLLSGPKHGVEFDVTLAKPYVISIVGVNGVGKTTTTGKLAAFFRSQGKSVLLAAADTFRAGAIAQLKIWADRTGADFITGREGADPGAVAFDSITAAKARHSDIVLLDTAGRLHTKGNLMDELKKIHRVVKKVIPEAPHERWLVVDGTLGQNSVRQAKEFNEALEITGIIITKLDGTAKGGVVFSLASELGLPIRFVGLGESAEDLTPFSAKPFVSAIFDQV